MLILFPMVLDVILLRQKKKKNGIKNFVEVNWDFQSNISCTSSTWCNLWDFMERHMMSIRVGWLACVPPCKDPTPAFTARAEETQQWQRKTSENPNTWLILKLSCSEHEMSLGYSDNNWHRRLFLLSAGRISSTGVWKKKKEEEEVVNI